MEKQYLIAVFKEEYDLLTAVRQARQNQYSIYDVFTPYAVHGLEEAMGLKASRLTYVCFAFALTGVLFAIFSQFWIGSINWPLNVGGKPFNSLPAYLPVTFELLVLFGGLGVFFTFFFWARLWPGKKVKLIFPGITDRFFVLGVEVQDASFDFEKFQSICKENNVVELKQVSEDAL